MWFIRKRSSTERLERERITLGPCLGFSVASFSRRSALVGMTIAGGFMLAGGLAAAVALFILPGSTHRPSVAEAEAFLAGVPSKLDVQPGEVLHKRVEVYERYGPKASIIAERTGIPTENHVRESWVQVGNGDSIVNSLGLLIDANGTTVQRSEFEGGNWHIVDPRTGKSLPTGSTPPPTLSAPQIRARQFQEALANGTVKVISQTASELTVENVTDVPADLANSSSNPDDYDVPYIADLDPVSIVSDETIGQDGITRLATTSVITRSGDRVPVLIERTVVNEVLSKMP